MEITQVSFMLKKIMGPSWEELKGDLRNEIIKAIFDYPLIGQAPNRFGFVKCSHLRDDWIYGYFTQEIEIEFHKYDEEKTEKRYTDKPFEDVLFMLLLDSGLCLINNRRFRDKNLTMALVVENFEKALQQVFDKIGLPYRKLEDYTLIRNKEYFLQLFRTEDILEIKVDNLKNQKVPVDFRIFNPDFDKDTIFKNYFNDEFGTLEKISLSADKNGKLQKSTIAKTTINTGEPNFLQYKERSTGNIRKIGRKLGPTFHININIENPQKNEILIELKKLFADVSKEKPGTIEKKFHMDLSNYEEGADK